MTAFPTPQDILKSIEARDGRDLLGRPGYSIPALDDVEIVALSTGTTLRNVTVAGQTHASSGYLIIHRQSNLRAGLCVTCHPSARDALVVVGRECSLHGTIDLYSEAATVLLSGEALRSHHGGHFAARLWSANNMLFVGKGSTTNGSQYVISGRDRAIIIGDDCMFAGNITLRTDDMHSIIDMQTGQRLNDAADVVLEPHIWLGQGAIVLKGVVLGLGSVVGAQSLVLQGCPRFSIIGGVPAKLLSTGRSWDRSQAPSLQTLEALKALDSKVPATPVPR
jgi:carbonic anhydrase/acetyltransferase-like protein (isoleucine patch superfamily)